MRLSMVALAAVLATAAPTAARADSRDEQARAQFEVGISLFEAGKHEQAAIAFERAYELKPSYRILYNLGQVQNELGHYAAALKAYSRYLAEGGDEIDPERVRAVKDELARLNKLVGMLIIDAEVRGAVVFVDDERKGKTPLESPVFVDLGKHTVLVKLGTKDLHRETVKVAGGQRVTIRIGAAGPPDSGESTDEPAGAPDPPDADAPTDEEPGRVWTWVAFGVGGAAAVAAGVTGGLAVSRKSTLEDNCPDKHCPDSEWSTMDSAETLATTTTALIVVAGVGLAAGVLLYFVEPDSGEQEREVSIAPTIDPNGFGISTVGRF